MHTTRILTLAAIAACASPAFSQIESYVGPSVAPEKSPIVISFSNDTNEDVITSACPFTIYDSLDNVVPIPPCLTIAYLVLPGSTFSTTWDQRDEDGLFVAPGAYRIDVNVPGTGIVSHSVEISPSADAAIASIGVPKAGTSRSLLVTAPDSPSQLYFLAASDTLSPDVSTCGGTFPLGVASPWVLFSIQPGNGVFQQFVGELDGSGVSQSPVLAFPDNPILVGLNLNVAGLILDAAAPCPVSAVTEPLSFTIQ